MITADELRQEIKKSRVLYIGSVIIIGLIVTAFIMFYKPKVKIDDTIIKQKESEIEANKRQIQAFEKLVDVQIQRIAEFARRDSVLIEIGLFNKANILKIKQGTNEKIKEFDSYGSSDWTAYFSNLPEPE